MRKGNAFVFSPISDFEKINLMPFFTNLEEKKARKHILIGEKHLKKKIKRLIVCKLFFFAVP